MKAAYRMLEPTPMGSTSTTSGAALLSTLLVVGIGCAAARVPQAAPGPRTMVVHSGRTIRELLQPEDKVVFLVHDDNVMVEAPPPPPRDALRRLLDVGPWYAVAVVKVNHAASSLNGTGTWVKTDLRATIEEVLRPVAADDMPLERGDSVDVLISGGEVAIEGVTVRTEDAPRFATDQRYLLALGPRDAMGQRMNSLGMALSVGQNDRLASIRPAPPSPLVGLSLTDAREVIRSRR